MALLQARGLKQVFVAYRDLVASPEESLQALAEDLDFSSDRARISQFCQRFVDASLHRSVANEGANDALAKHFPQVLEFNATIESLLANSVPIEKGIDHALEIYCREDTRNAIASAIGPARGRG